MELNIIKIIEKEDLEEKPPCPFCGTTERKWFRLRKEKPLIENFIDTCWCWED